MRGVLSYLEQSFPAGSFHAEMNIRKIEYLRRLERSGFESRVRESVSINPRLS